MYVDQCADVELNHSVIEGNIANSESGGGIFMSNSVNVSVRLNHVSHNSAPAGGGAGLHWLASSGMQEPLGLVATNVFVNNSALYGDDYATDTVMLSHNDSILKSSSNMSQVHLDTFNTDTTYAVKMSDKYGHIVPDMGTFLTFAIDNNSSRCGNNKAYITGQTVAESNKGRAEFQFSSYCNPGGSLELSVSASGLTAVDPLPLQISFRGCRRGEYYEDNSCQECAAGFYSIESNDELDITSCNECPDRASCQGSVISLDAGHWRFSNNTSVVFECPIEKACPGEEKAVLLVPISIFGPLPHRFVYM
jgi:hypothetical protein